ncbi:hypothetical protein AAC387_Pa06g1706 [Persea americana]
MKKLLSGSPSVSLFPICFWCVVNLLRLVELSQAQDATNATTDPSEVSALNSIFQKWGVSASSTWNTTGDPCSGSAIDDSVAFTSNDINPALKCLCNFNNGTTCRITQMRVSALDARGPIPEELGNLTKLFDLNLRRNYLTGPVPAFIGNLTDMQFLSLGTNALSGPIPKEIGKLQKLKSLGIGSNNFNGSLPPELGNLVNLEQLYMDSSGVGGEIPSTFSNLVNLKIVRASDSPFNGTIPSFIGSWNLTSLRLQGNSFQGSIPSSFSNLTSMTDLRISDISNGSSSLAFISNMKSLSVLILRNNMIFGTIPLNIGEYQSLQQLDLSFNNLTGQIPSSLFNLSSLSNLFLGNNNLSGTLPPSKSSLLLTVDLSYNQLSGSFPFWVTESGLQLNLVANNFVFDHSNSSTLPGLNCLQRNFPCNRGSPIYSSFAVNCGGQSITSSTGTVYEEDNKSLGAASYNVTNPIRWAVGNVGRFAENINATYISNSQSQFTSTLDSELFQTARLSSVSLRYYGLGLENGNYTISLQFVETAFEYSQTWQSVGRRIFDIYVQGSLALKDFDIQKAAGGVQFRTVERQFKALVSENHLEIHLFWAGKGTCCIPVQGTYGPSISAISVTPDFTPTVSNRPPTTTSSKKNKTGLAVWIAVPVGVLCLISVFVILIVRRIRRLRKSQEEEVLLGMSADTFSYSELKTATKEFNPANKLGEGGFGPVYKGALTDGRVIAVKQLSVASHQGKSQFVTEIATISAVQHRNLVKLYGCCIEGDRRLLVYEYLENKSLDQALFGETSLHLNWQTRYDICLGAARDFGLAKLYDDKKTHISTRVAGTIGYLAPEYAMRGHLTEKADVFAFGVVALEVLSGRPNSDTSLEQEKIYLLEWAWHLHETNRALELVDPTLVEFNEDEALRVIGVSLLCTQATPMLRPPMSRVVAMLSGDIELSSVISKPGYITDWQLKEINSFMSENTSGVSTEGTCNSQKNTTNASTAVTGQSSPLPCQPDLHEIIGEGR